MLSSVLNRVEKKHHSKSDKLTKTGRGASRQFCYLKLTASFRKLTGFKMEPFRLLTLKGKFIQHPLCACIYLILLEMRWE